MLYPGLASLHNSGENSYVPRNNPSCFRMQNRITFPRATHPIFRIISLELNSPKEKDGDGLVVYADDVDEARDGTNKRPRGMNNRETGTPLFFPRVLFSKLFSARCFILASFFLRSLSLLIVCARLFPLSVIL